MGSVLSSLESRTFDIGPCKLVPAHRARSFTLSLVRWKALAVVMKARRPEWEAWTVLSGAEESVRSETAGKVEG